MSNASENKAPKNKASHNGSNASNTSDAKQAKIRKEILAILDQRRSLQLATIQENGKPYASYAPFAIGDECLWVLLSEIAVHAKNLQANPIASALIIEDETEAAELFARIRVQYEMQADFIEYDSTLWQEGIERLHQRHGDRILGLSKLQDFKLFRLTPQSGRYVKGFGKAYSLAGNSLAGNLLNHMRDGHQKRNNSMSKAS